jgi:hypothetical protein
MERTRVGAATVREGWASGAGWAAGIGELVAGLAAGGMVIHDRSSRTGLGSFVNGGLRVSQLRRSQKRERLRSK